MSSGEDILRHGREAEYILQCEAFQKALAELDSGLVELWASGQFATPEQREEAFARVRGARMFKDRLVAMVDSMKVQKVQEEQRVRRARAAGHSEED